MPRVNFEQLEDPDFYWGETKSDLLTSALNICGCGSGAPIKILIGCLQWAALPDERKKENGWGKGFYRSEAHEMAAIFLDSYQLLEHGAGIGWAWISDDGKRLLEILEKIPDDEE